MELLAVIAIFSVLMLLATGALSGVLHSYRLAQAGQEVHDLLVGARMECIARNRLGEVRFCRRNGEDSFRHVAFLERDASGQLSLRRQVLRLPETVIFSDAANLSSLFAVELGNEPFPLPTLGSDYTYYSFQFRPDGSTDIPWDVSEEQGDQRHFVTLQLERETGSPPANFFTIEIDPRNGTITTFRP